MTAETVGVGRADSFSAVTGASEVPPEVRTERSDTAEDEFLDSASSACLPVEEMLALSGLAFVVVDEFGSKPLFTVFNSRFFVGVGLAAGAGGTVGSAAVVFFEFDSGLVFEAEVAATLPDAARFNGAEFAGALPEMFSGTLRVDGCGRTRWLVADVSDRAGGVAVGVDDESCAVAFAGWEAGCFDNDDAEFF